MKWILVLILIINMNNEFKIDFGTNEIQEGWQVVNDGVMGGLSQGRINYDESAVKFFGTLSLENNGGFSWAQYGLRNTINGDENHFKLRIKTDDHNYSITARVTNDRSYHYESKPICTNGEWQEITIATSSMIKTWRGRTFEEYLDVSVELSEIGLILKDKKEGAFSVDLDWILIE